MSYDLNEAKQRLLDKLGPNYGVYIQLLGKWFRGLISKEEFDRSAKQLIEQNFVLEHNKFWLSFFHHCANSASGSIQSHNFQLNDAIGDHYNHHQKPNNQEGKDLGPNFISSHAQPNIVTDGASKVRCLPNKVITHMKIFVIAWEMGLDSANDHVSLYINLALQNFLKNIITELICTKTAYRLRENRLKYAIGVKPINPYLNNSLKVYSNNLEYDPYQIESNKMNSSLVDTYAYNDSLFPSRLYEAQALYEYACSTTSVTPPPAKRPKLLQLSELIMSGGDERSSRTNNSIYSTLMNGNSKKDVDMIGAVVGVEANCHIYSEDLEDDQGGEKRATEQGNSRRLTLFHLLIAFLSNRAIIPSQSLYSINLERILTKLSH